MKLLLVQWHHSKKHLNGKLKFDLRPKKLCIKNIDHKVIYKYYSSIAQNDIVIHTTITCPFITEKHI